MSKEYSEWQEIREQKDSSDDWERRLMDTLDEFMGEAQEASNPPVDYREYTSPSNLSDGGFLRPGQVDPERLSDAALRNLSGNPKEDIPLWRPQTERMSCALACQSFVLRSEVDSSITEEQLIREAKERNLYTEKGTYLENIGALAELHGMERELSFDNTLEEIERLQAKGAKVLAMISGTRMAHPNAFGFFRADHVVQVVSIDRNDPENVRVILNDPGRKDGQGISVPADVFLKAWKTSKYSTVALYRRTKS